MGGANSFNVFLFFLVFDVNDITFLFIAKVNYSIIHSLKQGVVMNYIRICHKCNLTANTEKDLHLFVKNNKSKYGHANLCIKCKSSTDVNSRNISQEKKDLYNKNRRDKYSQLSEEDKQSIFVKNRERYYKNHNKYRDAINKRAREHREYYAEKCRKRRFNISNTTDNSITLASLEELKEKQNYKCFYCNSFLDFSIKQSVHLDHVKPFCKGGKHTLTNVVWACAKCNLKKGGKII